MGESSSDYYDSGDYDNDGDDDDFDDDADAEVMTTIRSLCTKAI